MPVALRSTRASLAVIAALAAAFPPAAPFAAPDPAEPTPDACARLGFANWREDDEAHGPVSQLMASVASTAAAPATRDVMVTAKRRAQPLQMRAEESRAGRIMPPAPPPPFPVAPVMPQPGAVETERY